MTIFENNMEYPDRDSILEGIPENTFWEYISSSYLDALINYVKIEKAWMLSRYEKASSNKDRIENKSIFKYKEEVSKIETAYHPKLCQYDDVIVVASSRNGTQSWLFWFDRDNSDCCIGRSNASVEEMIKEAEKITDSHRPFYDIEVDKIKGWISW